MSNALTRQIIAMKEEGKSYTQIGKVVGMSKDAVQKVYKRYLEDDGSAVTAPKLPESVSAKKSPKGYVGPTIAFYDIETTYSAWSRILSVCIVDGFGKLEVFRLDDPRYAGESWTDDSVLVKAVKESLEGYDIIVGWNSKLFDLPIINARLLASGQEPCDPLMHIDLMYKATGSAVRVGRKSLDNVSKYFGVENKKTPLDPRIWDKADHGDKAAYEKIIEHNIADVYVTRDVYGKLKRLVRNIHRGG